MLKRKPSILADTQPVVVHCSQPLVCQYFTLERGLLDKRETRLIVGRAGRKIHETPTFREYFAR